MNAAVVGIFSLLCGITGWFYLFYSKAAAKLVVIEPSPRNALRIRLRRVCGGAMFLLGIACFVGFNAVDERSPGAYLAVRLGVMFLLLVIILLVAADIGLTWKLRRKDPKGSDQS